MYTHVHTYMYTHVHTCAHILHTHASTHMYTCILTHVHACTHTHTHTHTHAQTCTFLYTHMYTSMYMLMSTHTHTLHSYLRALIETHTHMCTHTHVHMYSQDLPHTHARTTCTCDYTFTTHQTHITDTVCIRLFTYAQHSIRLYYCSVAPLSKTLHKVQVSHISGVEMYNFMLVNSFCGQSQLLRYTCCAKKKCCALQENVGSEQLTLYDQETTDQYVVDYKVLTV